MMSELTWILKAQKGDTAAFNRLFLLYWKKIYGFALYKLKNHTGAEEVMQNTLIAAFLGIGSLANPKSFGSWIYGICRNQIGTHLRAIKKRREVNIDTRTNLLSFYYKENENGTRDMVNKALSDLREPLREVLLFRYFFQFSYREIAALCGISERLVKSRLFEGKRQLRIKISYIEKAIKINPERSKYIWEVIMKTIERIKKGSYVFMRLSLHQQTDLCRKAAGNEAFDHENLSEIGKIREGKEFVQHFHNQLMFGELIYILAQCDTSTIQRLVSELEVQDPGLAKKIKENFFVFEDFTLVDLDAIKVLHDRVGTEIYQLALNNTIAEVKNHMLRIYSKTEQSTLGRKLLSIDSSFEKVNDARVKMVNEFRMMADEDLLDFKRDAMEKEVITILLKK
ncbi:MAG: sigma-70 family RNA polymerase sigma factor [Spirochaetales bacterium]|nr:sigma-70 family RNA polymerase sigma factor [Spirochaetales bacterium]